MNKSELLAKCQKLMQENEELQSELDRLNEYYGELENELVDRINELDATDSIKDVNWFKFRLTIDGLLTPELESYIEEHLKYHNN